MEFDFSNFQVWKNMGKKEKPLKKNGKPLNLAYRTMHTETPIVHQLISLCAFLAVTEYALRRPKDLKYDIMP